MSERTRRDSPLGKGQAMASENSAAVIAGAIPASTFSISTLWTSGSRSKQQSDTMFMV